MKHTFSIRKTVHLAWQIFVYHWKFILPLGAATVLAQLLITGAYQATMRNSPLLAMSLWSVSILFSMIISLGWSKIFLTIVRTNRASWETFKTEPVLWLHFLKTNIWYLLYVIGLMILVILPFGIIAIVGYMYHYEILAKWSLLLGVGTSALVMIYLEIRYQFIPFVVIDNPGLRSKVIFKKSGNITKKSFAKLVLFAVLSVGIAVLGLLMIGVGLIIAIPVIKIAQAKIYDTISK